MLQGRWLRLRGLAAGVAVVLVATLLALPAVAAAQVVVADVFVEQARYQPGAVVPVTADLVNSGGSSWTGNVTLRVAALEQAVATDSQMVTVPAGGQLSVTFQWPSPATDFQGYLAEVSADGATGTTGIDVSSDWTRFPRYGWLSEYPVGEPQAAANAKVGQLVRDYHLNGIQFYDWMWRHENVIKRTGGVPDDQWDDWSGKTISRIAVQNAIDAAHGLNVAAMPYSMAYAGLQGYEQISGVSPAWGIFEDTAQQNQFVFDFGDKDPLTNLWLFNPADSGWQNHITGEYRDQVNTMGFDGAHLDQLGQRDGVYDSAGNLLDLSTTFSDLTNATKANLQANDANRSAVTFNVVNGAVDGWAAEDVATNANVDFLYSEIWERSESYQSVRAFVEQSRRQAGYKPMVLAAYMNYNENAGARYEAEDAQLTGVAVDTDHTGYTGTGFVDQFGESGDSVTFTITADEARPYALVFRYANASNAEATRTISVDGVAADQVAFPSKDAWAIWEYDAYTVIDLQPGTHSVTISRTAADSGFINLDSLTLGTFNEPSVRLANAAFAAAGASHIEMGEGDQMLAHPYFPNRYKQMTNSLRAATADYYDFITAYQTLLFGSEVRPSDSGSQFIDIAGQLTSGDASANTIWNPIKRSPDYDVIQMVNLLGNNDQWRDVAAAPPSQANLQVKYYVGPDAVVDGVYLASPDRNEGVTQSLAYTSGNDANGRYLSFTVPSLEYWNMIYVKRTLQPSTAGRYEAEDALKTGVGVNTNFAGYTGSGFVDNWASDDTGVSFIVDAAAEDDYSLVLRYANGGTDATRSIYVDGRYAGRVTLDNTGGWGQWAAAQLTTRLEPGPHTVVVWRTSGDAAAANLDHLRLDPSYVWSRDIQITTAPAGYLITLRLEADGWVHWGINGWQNVTDTRLHPNGSADANGDYETTIGPFAAGTQVAFTFAFDSNGNGILDGPDQWEGQDYQIAVN